MTAESPTRAISAVAELVAGIVNLYACEMVPVAFDSELWDE